MCFPCFLPSLPCTACALRIPVSSYVFFPFPFPPCSCLGLLFHAALLKEVSVVAAWVLTGLPALYLKGPRDRGGPARWRRAGQPPCCCSWGSQRRRSPPGGRAASPTAPCTWSTACRTAVLQQYQWRRSAPRPSRDLYILYSLPLCHLLPRLRPTPISVRHFPPLCLSTPTCRAVLR